jgi:orotidine-5'-phosphate decarboxylase
MAELIVALDMADLDEALGLARKLGGRVSWFKIGLELFSAVGPRAVEALQGRGLNIFLDLKYLDIPNTVQAAARQAARLNVGMLTVHLSGGQRMVQAALEGCHQGASAAHTSPRVLGVTMLTSLHPEDIAWLHTSHSLADLVLDLAAQGCQWGVHGLVCSAREVARVKSIAGPERICVTPGIRPPNVAPGQDDQRRFATPGAAVAAGSDFLVVGRPITGAADPVQAAETLLEALTR